MSSRARLTALGAILLLAAVLRFVGISAGLRHTPFIDEQFFVVNVGEMLDRGDLDPRFQLYPGFFFYLLAPFLSLLPRPFGADAYLLARQVVAAFGVATVALVYLLGARIGNARAGLLGAAVLAVSPLAVRVAHEVRPDVVLGFFAMVALLAVVRVDGGWKADLIAGLTVGMATAIKFTGVTVALPYAVRRLVTGERRLRGMLLAGAFSLVAYAVLSPYSFLHFDEFVAGISAQKEHHDQISDRGVQSHWTTAGAYLGSILPGGLGGPALLAALGGLWARRRDWRVLLPLVALLIGFVAVLSTGQIHRSRFLLPALGAVAVLSGLGVDAVWKRSRLLGVGLTLAVAGWPLVPTVRAVAALRRPSTLDRALDWTEANIPAGQRVATVFTQIGLDRERHEVIPVPGWTPEGLTAEERRTAAAADVLIAAAAADGEVFAGFTRRFVARSSHPLEGPAIEVLTRVRGEEWSRLDLRGARLDASEGTDRLPLIVDGDLGTRWETHGKQEAGMWVEVVLPAPAVIDGVEIALGDRPNQWGRHLELAVSQDGREWTRVETVSGRAPVPEQVAEDLGRSQVLLLVSPTRASAVRVMLVERDSYRWGFAEIHLRVLDGRP